MIIINGGSRTNGTYFAKHLERTDTNERVEVCEIRGVCADNIRDALREMEAVASGTRCDNYFYHANINPDTRERNLTPEEWRQAVDTLERNLGLEGQPRFIVEHEKEGRTHRHVIWSRVDLESMTAISDSKTAFIHERTSRELEIEFGLERGQSVLTAGREGPRPERKPEHWAMIRGKDTGIDPRDVKRDATAAWERTDSGKAFRAAIEEEGYILARGDRRDFVLIDSAGNDHSLARRLAGVRVAGVLERLADIDRASLPSVTEAQAMQTDRQQARETERQQGGESAARTPGAEIRPDAMQADRQNAGRAEMQQNGGATIQIPRREEFDRTKPETVLKRQERARAWQQESYEKEIENTKQTVLLTEPQRQERLAALEHRHTRQIDQLTINQFHERQAARVDDPERDKAAQKLIDARQSAEPKRQTEKAVHGMANSATKSFATVLKTGEKLMDLVSGAADFFFATPRTVTPQQAAASREAMIEYAQAAAFDRRREMAYDRMMEERAAGKHLSREDVRYLSEADRTNYRRYGDTALDQMFRDREIEEERKRGRGMGL